MGAQMTFRKALHQLDRGMTDAGEASLREAIGSASIENDDEMLVTASVCLGDLLWQLERQEEARPMLERALACDVDEGLAELLDDHLQRARELLGELDAN